MRRCWKPPAAAFLRAGLGFDRCDVAVVTNIGEGDHLGPDRHRNARKAGPREAYHRRSGRPERHRRAQCRRSARGRNGAKSPAAVVFFSPSTDHPVIAAHRAAGGRAVTVRDGIVMLAEGELEIPLVRLDRVPLTHGGRIALPGGKHAGGRRRRLEPGPAARSDPRRLGIVRRRLASTCPGRFNLLEVGGATVIVDYGHNASSLIAVIEAMEQFPHERRTAVYTCAGDRRDCDMIRQGELLGQAFDRVILYEDHYVRGRKPGEIMGLLTQGLAGATRRLKSKRSAVRSRRSKRR